MYEDMRYDKGNYNIRRRSKGTPRNERNVATKAVITATVTGTKLPETMWPHMVATL